MNKTTYILLALSLLITSSCVSTQQIESSQLKSLTSNGIAVFEKDESKPRFNVVGTTAFNNKSNIIRDSDVSFASYLAKRLRDKGYKAYTTDSHDHSVVLSLYPTYPYGNPGLTGVGFFRRSFMGMSSPIIAYCNMRGTIQVTSDGKKFTNSQPINYGDKGYTYGNTSIDKEVNSWNDLTSSEKNTLKADLEPHMKKQADLILSQLGL